MHGRLKRKDNRGGNPMALTLDFRVPVFVMVAQFNPAIFEMQWMAKHLLERQVGDAIQGLDVVMQHSSGLLHLKFLEGVALNVAEGRTEILMQDGTEACINAAEARLVRLLTLLPHTPLSAIGCNFEFVDPTPPQAIIDLFDTQEALEGQQDVLRRQVTVQLRLDDATLNLTRVLSDEGCRFSFNYHRNETDWEKYVAFIPGMIVRQRTHAENLLRTIYHYDEISTVGFVGTLTDGEDANVQEDVEGQTD